MLRMVCSIWLENVFKNLEVIIQTRVEGLPPIPKHREMLKIQGEAEYSNFGVFSNSIIHEASTKKMNTVDNIWKSEEEIT